MRKSILLALFVALLVPGYVFAEDAAKEAAKDTAGAMAETAAADASQVSKEAVAPAPAQDAAPAAATAETTAAPAAAAAEATDNLEFVSGEVSAANEAAKSVTLKLYGENDNQPTEKTLTVTIDESTDITDGEADKDIKALNVGTEVDVEYDPKTNKATYIFVY